MTGSTPWRSLLFVPADNERLLSGAHRRGAHALVLDLEDSVSEAGKEAARQKLPGQLVRLAALDQRVTVRVNSGAAERERDLRAAVGPGLRAVVLPKAEDPAEVADAAAALTALERERGLPEGSVGIVPLIESPAALFALSALATAPRVRGLALGSEDFSLRLGVAPTPAVLTEPCRWIALAAAAAGVASYALPVSLATLDGGEELTRAARQARELGATGALCVHPAQVAAVNAAWLPSVPEVSGARRIADAWRARERGAGAIRVDGLMVDAPVARRALDLLAEAGDGGAEGTR
ncbi:HpcH/HpaI aldolase/citrate lyase family protein [Streptomyces sp. NPDC056987]|uniref:HpcH/HpaI aldolase/citrate lyase family protein n=1 Tax=Streptomyces sp. NPDC056987 TaxID=3345988 RepID=UPI00362D86E8